MPAVRTLALAGVQRFRDRLYDLGYCGLNEDGEYYGFALALGSAEVSLMEQVRAYRASRATSFGLGNPLTTRYWTAVKTGTSKDMRDNWCIGFSRH